MKYQAVIFDFDYTLGDSENGIVASICFALDQLGYGERDMEAMKKTIGMSLKNTFVYLTGSESEEEAARFGALFKQKADEVMADSTRLYPFAVKLLALLKERDCMVGIVTTKFHYRIEQILDKFGITSLVDYIVGGEDVKEAKPNPEGLFCIIEKMGLSKDSVLYIGDSWIDASAAHSAKVDFAGVTTGTTAREEFEKYPYICILESLEELSEWFEVG